MEKYSGGSAAGGSAPPSPSAQKREELVDFFLGRRPAAHQPRSERLLARAIERLVEGPQIIGGARRLRAEMRGARDGGEDRVRLGRMHEARPRQRRDPLGQPRRHRIRMGGKIEPQPARQIGQHLRRKEAVLREEMPRPLAPQLEVARARGVEQDHRLDAHAAVLRAAKAQHIDARLPGHLGRARPGRDQGIGKARPVHVHRQAEIARDGRERRHLGHRIDGARLGRIGDRDHAALQVVDAAAAGMGDGAAQRSRVHLRMRPVDQRQLAAADEEFGRAALVFLDMGGAVAEDRLPGRAEHRTGQRIRHRPRRHQIDRGLRRLEDLAQPHRHRLGQRIGAIGRHVAGIRGLERRHDLRGHPRGVVRGEMHHGSSMMNWSHRSSGTSVSDTVRPRTEIPASCTVSCEPETR
ncbi:hypothetical protein SDC9_16927 [bioreactor metagenome]|uniref:Uncharacterized protein n=1 Tax=bioreactor metagenome TaxID=1076179 RepID=A0A644TVZ4_9ZZZZ